MAARSYTGIGTAPAGGGGPAFLDGSNVVHETNLSFTDERWVLDPANNTGGTTVTGLVWKRNSGGVARSGAFIFTKTTKAGSSAAADTDYLNSWIFRTGTGTDEGTKAVGFPIWLPPDYGIYFTQHTAGNFDVAVTHITGPQLPAIPNLMDYSSSSEGADVIARTQRGAPLVGGANGTDVILITAPYGYTDIQIEQTDSTVIDKLFAQPDEANVQLYGARGSGHIFVPNGYQIAGDYSEGDMMFWSKDR